MDVSVEKLITFEEPADLAACSLSELRALRDDYQVVENGLSYARRIVQGRLDTVAVEFERRIESDADTDLVHRLPNALAAHTRGPGLPRPGRELDPPSWADDIVAAADRMLGATALADLSSVPEADLAVAVSSIAELEQAPATAFVRIFARVARGRDA